MRNAWKSLDIALYQAPTLSRNTIVTWFSSFVL